MIPSGSKTYKRTGQRSIPVNGKGWSRAISLLEGEAGDRRIMLGWLSSKASKGYYSLLLCVVPLVHFRDMLLARGYRSATRKSPDLTTRQPAGTCAVDVAVRMCGRKFTHNCVYSKYRLMIKHAQECFSPTVSLSSVDRLSAAGRNANKDALSPPAWHQLTGYTNHDTGQHTAPACAWLSRVVLSAFLLDQEC